MDVALPLSGSAHCSGERSLHWVPNLALNPSDRSSVLLIGFTLTRSASRIAMLQHA
jgi:hypothetical protein